MSVSDDVKELYKKTSDSTVNKNYILDIDGITYDNENVVFGSFSLTEKLCSSEQLRFGECNASMLKLKMVADIGDISEKKIVLSQAINENSVAIGKFNVDSCVLTENKQYRDIVAYDNIILFNTNVSDWYNSLEFPIKMNNMLISLCESIGVEMADIQLINGEVDIEKTINPEDLKGITVLKSIAELNGGFFRATAEGKLEFVTLNTSLIDDYLEVKHYRSLKTENYTTDKITRLVIRTEEDDIGASTGEGDNAYIIQDNFLLYGSSTDKLKGIAETIYEAVKDITYIPYTAEHVGLPYLKCGSQISYKLVNGENFVGLMLQRTLTGTQVLKDTVKTSGTKNTKSTYGAENDVIKLKNRINRLKRTIEETNLVIENLEENLTNEIQQTDNELSVLVKKIAQLGDTGVTDIVVMYAISDTSTDAPTKGWSDVAPDWVDGKFIWQKTVTTYGNGETYESNAICITGATGSAGADGKNGENGKDGADGATGPAGADGKDGADGKGIKSITEYYAVSNSNSTVPTSWETSVQTMTSVNKYLWNYEKITYTDGSSSETSKRVIGVYGDTGATGATGGTGATGVGISNITNYYLATSASSGVTTTTSGWTTTVQSVTSAKKYLWNYEVVKYTNNTTSTTTPCIIGTYGDTGATGPAGADGEDGLTITSIVPQYYVSTSKTTLTGGSWSTTAPTWSKGKYVWTRSKITYSDSTCSYSAAVCDTSWEVANAIQAELALKIDKEKLISEINAAADVIKLLSNRLIIESTYFKLNENGAMECTSGKIGGFSISDKLTATISDAYIDPSSVEINKIRNSINGSYTLTTQEKTASDLNADGSVTIKDLLLAQKISFGVQNYSDCAGAKKSSVTVEINPKDSKKLIKLSGTNAWGRALEQYFGINGIKVENVLSGIVTGDIVQTSAGANLDDINSNLSDCIKYLGTYTFSMTVQSTKSLGRGQEYTVTLDKNYPTARFGIINQDINGDWVIINLKAWKDAQHPVLTYQNFYTSALSGNVSIHIYGN